jgi:regulator of cell morphogenesis and NO signaling
MKIRLSENQTVGQFAVQYPAFRATLEQQGIDYCCGGKRTLQSAAKEAGLTLEQLESIVNQAAGRLENQDDSGQNWSQADLEDLADHIESRHHTYLKENLPRLGKLLQDVLRAHADRHGRLLSELSDRFAELENELVPHLAKEEQILFPYIRQIQQHRSRGQTPPPMHCGTVENPILQMEYEHDHAGQALLRMRQLTSDYRLPGDACAKFRALYEGLQELESDLHEHIHLENNILFPRAIALEKGTTDQQDLR